MNEKICAKRLILPILAGVFALSVVGCESTRDAPVRDSRPKTRAKVPVRTLPAPAPVATARTGEHIVRQGETIYAISRQYGVSVSNLIAWNNLPKQGWQISVGQTVRVAPPGSDQASGQVETIPLDTATAPPDSANPPPVKREPHGGRLAWSESAWAQMQQPQGTEPAAQPPEGVAAPIPPAGVPPVATDWIWPIKGTILSRFNEPSGADAKVNNRGIDIAGSLGTPILAVAGGTVVYSGSAMRGYGKLVIVRHNAEYLTAYAHNRVILVKENDTVSKGQKIAELGDTDADRPKLHFEVRKQGNPVDPLKYLPTM